MQQQVLQSLHDDPAGGCHSVGRVQLPRVKVFDSLYLSLPTMAKAQIASLLCTEQNIIEVHIMDIQTQVHQLAIMVAIV